jgi:hypothetical protein
MSINWDEEPVAIVGLTKAILAVAVAAGFAISDQQAASIVAAVTAIVTLATTFVVRRKVTSPATAKRQSAQAGVLSTKLAAVSTTPFAGNGVSGYNTSGAASLIHPASTFEAKALGRRPAKNARALTFADHLTAIPAYPIVDVAPGLSWPMDHNDTVGCCVIAGLDHALQTIYMTLDGAYQNWSDAEMLTCYRTQNPKFRSWTQGGTAADGGMDIQTFLEYLVKQKVILGFAKVDHTNLDEVKAATYLGLALVTGETLTTKNLSEQVWDYHRNDPEEGGHATVAVGYDPLEQQVSWGALYSMTDSFFQHNVEEAWFIVTQAHIDHPAFRAGFDINSFAAAYEVITGSPFPGNLPTPDGDFAAAVATVPGLDSWLARNGTKHAMSGVDYAVWKLAGDAKLRK